MRRIFAKQGTQYAAHRATGTEQQDPCPRKPEQVVAAKITHQTNTVRVVAVQAVVTHHQGVDRTGGMSTVAQRTCEAKRTLLERHGNIEAAATAGDKLPDVVLEFLEVPQDTFIAHVLTGLQGERSVDLGRFGMRYRVADHGIQVGHLFAVVLASGYRRRIVRALGAAMRNCVSGSIDIPAAGHGQPPTPGTDKMRHTPD